MALILEALFCLYTLFLCADVDWALFGDKTRDFHFQLLCAPKINTIENKQFNWMKSSEFQTEKQMYKIFGAHKTQKTKGSNSGCG